MIDYLTFLTVLTVGFGIGACFTGVLVITIEPARRKKPEGFKHG